MTDKLPKALVIDDNEVNTIVLANMLELFDIRVDQANSGIQAVQLLRDNEYGIIFVDHVMPKMDGVQTTETIRSLPGCRSQTVIIALTSSTTEEICRLYQLAGADEVYAKPLGLLELANILKNWCPWLSVQEVPGANGNSVSEGGDILIKSIIDNISEIDYETGLRYAVGNPKHYADILRVSLKDIRACQDLIIQGYEKQQKRNLCIGIHNMKSVFTNIGATELADLARGMEQVVAKQEIASLEIYFQHFIKRIGYFFEKLEQAMEKYDSITGARLPCSMDCPVFEKDEYEQRIANAIYYIRRFDYAAILEELEQLIKRGRLEHRQELELAMAEIKEYQYESSLYRLMSIKKEMETNSIPAEAD